MQTLRTTSLSPLDFLVQHYSRIPASFRTRTNRFESKVRISFERGNFLVRTAESEAELEKVLQLRYEIFHREFQGKFLPFGIDIEALDSIADHLLVIDKENHKIVGTYRLISSSFSSCFYSQSEFQIERFLNTPGTKLEMSRAGIHKDYRSGITMALLWRGVSEYMKKVGASYIFGCASIKTWSLENVRSLQRELKGRKCLGNPFEIYPTAEYQPPTKEPFFKEKKKIEIPALMNGYLKAGAQVTPEPAWDKDFRCVDFLTILEIAEMNPTFEKRYIQSKSGQ